MAKSKQTKKALLSSVIALILCLSMLIGTTFAWFTDSVESGVNTILAGNLDVELYHTNKVDRNEQVKSDTILFDDVASDKWEPGVVVYENFVVANEGSLALKYSLSINFENATVVNGHSLVEALQVAVVEDGFTGGRADVADLEFQPLKSFVLSGVLEGNTTSKTYGIVIYWEPSANDNWFNMNNGNKGEILSIDLGVNLFATQEMYESDSFGDDYDKLAPWAGKAVTKWYDDDPAKTEFTITSAEELAGLAKIVNEGTDNFNGKTVKLGANIDLNDLAWTPIGTTKNPFNGKFIGTGYTISNLYVTGTNGVGLFGNTWTGAHIEGVTIDGAYVAGNDYVGAVLGNGYLSANCIKNCIVKNAEIIAMPYLMADGKTYDGGAKAGVVAGYAKNGSFIGNQAIDCKVSAYRDLGGIVGMAAGEDWAIEVSGNTVENLTLVCVGVGGAPYEGGKVSGNMGDFVGRPSNADVKADNTVKGNVDNENAITYHANGIQYVKNADNETVTLYKVNDAYTSENLVVPQGVTALGYKVLQGNTTIKEVVIPAGLTDFGGVANADGKGASGGFFYKSAVEKVILPEGLTEIPDAAFNGASNLKEVNIPSTVTTIGINAFAYTAMSELTVPATVKSIGYGAFRGMANLTTVTIEGNVNIPGYAFRSCTNLKTIVLAGDNVTFDKGMIFSHYDTGASEGMLVYVANETVKDRLLAADSSARYYTVVIATTPEGDNVAEKAQSVVDALDKGGDVVLTEDLSFSSADTTANSGYGATGVSVKGGTLDGNGNSLGINNWGTWDAAVHTTGGTIKNLTVNSGMRGIFMGSATADVYIDNVIIDGTVYTFNSDGGSKEYGVYISNSTLNGWTSHSDVHKEVVYTNCNFGEGSGYAFCRPYGPTVFENCVFEEGFEFDTSKTSNIVFKNCYYGETLITPANALTLGNGETTFFYNGLNGITINEKKVVVATDNAELAAAVNAGNSNTAIVLTAGEYELAKSQIGVTIVGVGEEAVELNATVPIYDFTGKFPVRMHFENLTFTNTISTFQDTATAEDGGVSCTFTNVTFAAGFRHGYGTRVVFTDCTFGSNSEGYALHFEYDSGAGEIKVTGCKFEGGKVHLGGQRTYAFTNCDFAEKTDFQIWTGVTLDNCTVDGVAITADNLAGFFPDLDVASVTIK